MYFFITASLAVLTPKRASIYVKRRKYPADTQYPIVFSLSQRKPPGVIPRYSAKRSWLYPFTKLTFSLFLCSYTLPLGFLHLWFYCNIQAWKINYQSIVFNSIYCLHIRKNPVNQDSLINGFILFSAVAVVGKHTGGGVVDVAAFPAFVRHPEVNHHPCLTGVIFFKYFPIQK